MWRDKYICDVNPTLSHSAHYYIHVCLFTLELVTVEVPEEPFNELLLFRHSVLQDSNRDGGGVVLVLWQSNAGDPLSGLLVALWPVERLQVLQELGLSAHPPLGPVSALEEEHLASEHPGHGAPVEGGGRPALGHLVAVVVLGRDLSSPFGILRSAALDVKGESVLGLLGRQSRGVVLNVDLHVLGQLEEGVAVGAEEGVPGPVAMAGEVEGGFHLHALSLSLLHVHGVLVHIRLSPAFAPEVVDVDAPQQLGLIGAGTSGDGGEGEKEHSLHR